MNTPNPLRLKKLTRLDAERLELSWSDGHAGPVHLQMLRDACPCAGCQGETVLLHHYAPAPDQAALPGKYDLKGAEPVGTYALKLVWGDGHEQGLYTWEHLRALCSCTECLGKREAKGMGIPL